MDPTTPVSNDAEPQLQSTPLLPLELFQRIIEQVAEGLASDYYQSSLRADVIALSLACRVFNQLCRPHLFRLIEIYFVYPFKHQHLIQRLATTLMDRPTWSLQHHSDSPTAFIQEVRYTSNEKHTAMKGHERATLNFKVFLNLLSVKILNIGLLSLKSYADANVHTFGFRALLDGSLDAGSLESLFIGRVQLLPILRILSSPNLHTLYIKRCTLDIPPGGWTRALSTGSQPFALRSFSERAERLSKETFAIISSCPQLKYLALKYDAPARISQFIVDTPDPVLFPNLEQLTFNFSSDWVFTCERAGKAGLKAFPKLKKVVFDSRPNESLTEPNVVFEHFEGLQELHVQGSEPQDFGLLGLDVCTSNCWRTLATISITWTFQQDYTPALDLVIALCLSLESMKGGDNVLQHLELRLEVGMIWAVNPENDVNFEPWRRLDGVLAGDPRRFPCLKTVSLSLLPLYEGGGESHSAALSRRLSASLINLQLAENVTLYTRVMKS